MLFSVAYLVVRRLLSCLIVLARSEVSKDAEHHLRQVVTEYLIHYNTARPHRALDQLPPAQAHTPPSQINLAEHQIRRKQVLDGLIGQYQIAA